MLPLFGERDGIMTEGVIVDDDGEFVGMTDGTVVGNFDGLHVGTYPQHTR